LQSERHVIALDVRGHGESERPLQQDLYSYSTMARDFLNLMDDFGISKADFMGYSMGAYLLGHHSGRFNSVILGGIGDETKGSVAIVDIIAEALRADDVSDIANPIGIAYRRFVDQDPRNDRAGREALALAALQMWPEGFPIELGGPSLGDVDIPVLIANGAADFPYVETCQDFAAAIPDRDHLGAVTDPLFKDEVLAFLKACRHD
jgi:pimeloyl-ACP methyl ester carboxylesterase